MEPAVVMYMGYSSYIITNDEYHRGQQGENINSDRSVDEEYYCIATYLCQSPTLPEELKNRIAAGEHH